MSYEHFSIEPTNRSSDSKYGFSSSNSVIQFSLPTTTGFLVGDSVKICYKFQVLKSDGSAVADADKCCISIDAGLQNLWSNVDIGSFESGGLSFENIRQYPKMCASLLTNGFLDRGNVFGKGSHQGISFGEDFQRSNCGTTAYAPSFSTKLYSGFLMGNKIPLMSANSGGVGGLRVSLQCQNDSFIIQDSGTGGLTGLKYELTDVSMRGIIIRPSEEETVARKLKSDFIRDYSDVVMKSEGRRVNQDEIDQGWNRQMELARTSPARPINFNSINGYLATLNSANSSITMNINLQNCVSAYMNIIKSDRLNNQTADSGSIYFLEDSAGNAQPLDNVRFSRGGILYPILFDLESGAQINYNTNYTQTNTLQGEMYLNSVNSTMPFDYKCKVLGSIYYGLENTTYYRDDAPNDKVYPKNATLGVRFSSLAEGTGANFKDKPIQVNLDSVLIANNVVSHTLYLFVVNRQSIINENGNLRVVS